MRRPALIATMAALLLVAGVPDAAAGEPRGVTMEPSDYEGDGYGDLAIGVPGEDVGGHDQAGAVHILRGSGAGVTGAGDQVWSLDTPGIVGVANAGDWFGSAVASGDFDGDGDGDLAIGASRKQVNAHVAAGVVLVLSGSEDGLTADDEWYVSQQTAGIADEPQEGDRFGAALAAADFDGDEFVDLAIGVPGEERGGVEQAGMVQILFGSDAGLGVAGAQLIGLETPGVVGIPAEGDELGSELAAGDFDGDGLADLAVGLPARSFGSSANQGSVSVLYGSASGLEGDGPLWTQATPGVAGAPEFDDRFGQALAAGDFDGDLRDDLAIGVPGEDLTGDDSDWHGAVHVLSGSDGGLTATGDQLWERASPGVEGDRAFGDRFGQELAAGRFDRGPYADLAIGVPEDDHGDVDGAGSVNVLYGTSAGLAAGGDQLWHQASAGIPGGPEADDRFGSALGAVSLEDGTIDELMVGVAGEDLEAWRGTGHGVVHVIYGGGAGLVGTGSDLWSRASPGVLGAPQSGARLGAALDRSQ